MATFEELDALTSDSDLLVRVRWACTDKAHALLTKVTPSADEKAFANEILNGNAALVQKIVRYVLAENDGLTVAQISGASETAIQNNVNVAIDLLVGV